VDYADLPLKKGILVSEVEAGSPAAKAGLKGGERERAVRVGRTTIYLGGDIIVEVDGTQVSTIADLYASMEDNKPGETLSVKVIRNGSEKTLKITLSER